MRPLRGGRGGSSEIMDTEFACEGKRRSIAVVSVGRWGLEGQPCPRDAQLLVDRLYRWRIQIQDQPETKRLRKGDCVRDGNRVNGAILRRNAALDREGQPPAGREQRSKDRQGGLLLVRIEVRPHGRQLDEVEDVRPLVEDFQMRQAIGDPVDIVVGMADASAFPQSVRWLNSDDFMTKRGEPGGVAPCTSADIEDARRLLRHEVEDGGVDGTRIQRVVSLEQVGGAGVVTVQDKLRHGRLPAVSPLLHRR